MENGNTALCDVVVVVVVVGVESSSKIASMAVSVGKRVGATSVGNMVGAAVSLSPSTESPLGFTCSPLASCVSLELGIVESDVGVVNKERALSNALLPNCVDATAITENIITVNTTTML